MAPPPKFRPLRDPASQPTGCDYMLSRNMLFFVEMGTGRLSFIDMSADPPAYDMILNSLYFPQDVVLSADGRHAYITEQGGTLLRAIAYPPTRRSGRPSVVSGGLGVPHQIALDEDRGHAYVVDAGAGRLPGRLLRIDLQSGEQTALVSDLEEPIGLLVTKDLRFAYVSHMNGEVSRIELNTGRRKFLVTGLAEPGYLTWADAGEGAIFITERPTNQVSLIDLTQTPVRVSPVATGVPNRPRSVAVIAPNHLVLCSQLAVSELDLTETVYMADGPILLGIGHVPVDRIVNGYADTTRDPITGDPEDYFFSVKDAPFGGTLPLMFNHKRALLDEEARYYQVLVDKEEQRQSWSDYWWNASEGRFELRTTSPVHDAYYPVHPSGELWYHPWLGYMLNTSGLSNGEHMISVRLFADPDPRSEIGSHEDDGRFVVVQIDNRWPTAAIDQIIHHHEEPDGTVAPVVVDTCAIVEEETDEFTFRITAYDQEGHLKSWHLEALWGDNGSDDIASGSYAPTPSREWPGIREEIVPSSPWHATVHVVPGDPTSPVDPTSRRCAHTFYLRVWDRVINGWGHLHGSRYHKSITIMLPPI